MTQPRAHVEVLPEYCKACGLCMAVCPTKLLQPGTRANSRGYFAVEAADPDSCLGCSLCATVCPDMAIEIYKPAPGPVAGPIAAPRRKEEDHG